MAAPRAAEKRARLDALASEVAALEERHRLGDVRDREYARQRGRLVADLARARVAAALQAGESALADHYYVQSHFPFTSLVLSDLVEEAVLYCATDRRLLRWSSSRPAAGGGEPAVPEGRLESIKYEHVNRFERAREYRKGEALVGAVMVVAAALLWSWLEITGPLLLVVGAAGLAHALLAPTPYWLIGRRGGACPPWRIYAARDPSARHLATVVQERTRAASARRA